MKNQNLNWEKQGSSSAKRAIPDCGTQTFSGTAGGHGKAKRMVRPEVWAARQHRPTGWVGGSHLLIIHFKIGASFGSLAPQSGERVRERGASLGQKPPLLPFASGGEGASQAFTKSDIRPTGGMKFQFDNSSGSARVLESAEVCMEAMKCD